MVADITDETFQQEVLESEIPVVVDFWASWCGPCKALAPILEQAAEFYGDEVKIVKLNTEANRQVPSHYGIRSLPTVAVFKDGELFDAMVGLRPPDQLKGLIDRALKGPGFLSKLKGFFRSTPAD